MSAAARHEASNLFGGGEGGSSSSSGSGGSGGSASAADAESAAAGLRDSGNGLFKEQRYAEAAGRYREALALLQPAAAPGGLGCAVRLNLATCLQRMGGDPEEAIALCDEVLAAEPASAKALFRRGALRHGLAAGAAAGPAAAQREALQLARRDLADAARAEPQDRQVRALLEEVVQALRRLPVGTGAAGGPRLGRGLYDDRPAAAPPRPPPPPCRVCGRAGHASCGRARWLAQRAEWLGLPEEVVGREPSDFEDDGTLAAAAREARRRRGLGTPRGLEELSDEERELLEDCLDSTERPFPQPKRRLPLAQAVRCAEELWAEDG